MISINNSLFAVLLNKLNLLNDEIGPSSIVSFNNIQHVKLWPIAIFSARLGTFLLLFNRVFSRLLVRRKHLERFMSYYCSFPHVYILVSIALLPAEFHR